MVSLASTIPEKYDTSRVRPPPGRVAPLRRRDGVLAAVGGRRRVGAVAPGHQVAAGGGERWTSERSGCAPPPNREHRIDDMPRRHPEQGGRRAIPVRPTCG